MATPTVRRLQLGHELRHLREKAGVGIDDAAKIVERGKSTISRLELGQTALTQRQLGDLIDFYRSKIANCEDTEWLFELAKGNEQRGRWSGYRAIYNETFRMAVDLEHDASVIQQYQTELVPGLLQTEEYVRALLTSVMDRTVDQQIESGIRTRLERQQVLTKENPPAAGFILSESAIRRTVGNPQVMYKQLLHLAEVALLPNVQLQVLPFNSSFAPQVIYNFHLYRIPSPGKAGPLEFAHLEVLTEAQYSDRPDDVDAYRTAWQRLVASALGPVESRAFIIQTAQEISGNTDNKDLS